MGYATLVFRFVLASIFVFAGAAKLLRPSEFEKAVRGYELLPPRVASQFARVLPLAEVCCGFLLAAGAGTRIVASVDAMMLLGFGLAISVNLIRGLEIECGCFPSAASAPISWRIVSRNAGLGALALVLVWYGPTALSVDLFFTSSRAQMSTSDGLAVVLTSASALAVASLVRHAWDLSRLSWLTTLNTGKAIH